MSYEEIPCASEQRIFCGVTRNPDFGSSLGICPLIIRPAAKLITLTLGNSVKAAAGAAAFVTGQTTTQAGADRRSPYRLIPRGGL